MTKPKTPAEIAAAKIAERMVMFACHIADGFDKSGDVSIEVKELVYKRGFDCELRNITEAYAEKDKLFDAMAAYVVSRGDIRGQAEYGIFIEREIRRDSHHLAEITEAAKRHKAREEEKG